MADVTRVGAGKNVTRGKRHSNQGSTVATAVARRQGGLMEIYQQLSR
jgi:hypothetical protein